MCFSLPVKVISNKRKKIQVKIGNKKKKVSGSLVKVKVEDWVFLRNNFIVGKINKKGPKILKLSKEEKKRKIRSLIRAYDPCISCATH